MSNKQKKKRNKKYTGVDAAVTRPTIVKVSAVDRSALGQWWFDHKRIIKPVSIAVGVAILLAICIIGIVQIIH